MTHEDEGNYGGKHPSGTLLDERIAGEIRKRIIDGRVRCATAHAIAEECGVTPADVGVAIDLMEVRIAECQNGLFGYGEKKRIVRPLDFVPEEISEAITKAATEGHLTCAESWSIARRLGIPKMTVSAACETMGVKITHCQLGAFD